MSRIIPMAACAALTTATFATEVIGPWTVDGPDSASLISGSFNSNLWLNVANAPVDVNTAFSGGSILEDGFANSATGLTFEVVFDGSVINEIGADLVLFDARWDNGAYAITIDADDFTTTVLLGADDFIIAGEPRDYYFGTSGPHYADIWGAEIDLSDFGLALGDSVNAVRFRSTNNATDPIGIGNIVPCPIEFRPEDSNLVGNIFGKVTYKGQVTNLEDGFPAPAPEFESTFASLESGGTIVDGPVEITTLIARFDAVIIGNEMFLESEESGYLDANASGFGEVAVSVGFPFVFRVLEDSHFVASDTFTFDVIGDGASINGSFLTAGDYTLAVDSPLSSMPAPGESYSAITTAYFALLDSCPGDIADPIGEVNISDLLALLANWDFDGPGANLGAPFDVVEVSDLLSLLANWGSCEP